MSMVFGLRPCQIIQKQSLVISYDRGIQVWTMSNNFEATFVIYDHAKRKDLEFKKQITSNCNPNRLHNGICTQWNNG